MTVMLSLGGVIAALDQWTKHLVRQSLEYGERVVVAPGFFNLVHLRNTGAAWGMLSGQNALLIVFAILILLALLFFHHTLLADTAGRSIILGLLLGGVTGNLIDRVHFGWVTDFIDLHLGGLGHWPSFNIADASICTAVGMYAVVMILQAKRGEPDAKAETESNPE